MNRYTITLLTLLTTTQIDARTLVVAAEETTLLPQIIRMLGELVDINSKDKKLFDRVLVTNIWDNSLTKEADLGEFLRRLSSSTAPTQIDTNEIDKRIKLAPEFRDADAFLQILVSSPTASSFLEFQFVITDSLPDKGSGSQRPIITDKTRYLGFVLDLNNDVVFQDLESKIRALFPQANRPPIVNLRVNNQYISDNETTIKLDIDKSVLFDASGSYDPDQSKESLAFSWSQRKLSNEGGDDVLWHGDVVGFSPYARRQEIFFTKRGTYELSVRVSDGAKSDVKMITIHVVPSPRLHAIQDTTIYYTSTYLDILSDRNSNKKTLALPIHTSPESIVDSVNITVVKFSSTAQWNFLFRKREYASPDFGSAVLKRRVSDSESDSLIFRSNINRVNSSEITFIDSVFLVAHLADVASDTLYIRFKRNYKPFFNSTLSGGVSQSRSNRYSTRYLMNIRFFRQFSLSMGLSSLNKESYMLMGIKYDHPKFILAMHKNVSYSSYEVSITERLQKLPGNWELHAVRSNYWWTSNSWRVGLSLSMEVEGVKGAFLSYTAVAIPFIFRPL